MLDPSPHDRADRAGPLAVFSSPALLFLFRLPLPSPYLQLHLDARQGRVEAVPDPRRATRGSDGLGR